MEILETVLVPGGEFEMGDHIGFGAEDPNHPWYHVGFRVVRNAQ